MPYAPEDAFRALVRQWLSLVHNRSRHGIWSMLKPTSRSRPQPICRLPVKSLHVEGTGYGGRGLERVAGVSRLAAWLARLAWAAAALAAAPALACAFAAAAAA